MRIFMTSTTAPLLSHSTTNITEFAAKENGRGVGKLGPFGTIDTGALWDLID